MIFNESKSEPEANLSRPANQLPARLEADAAGWFHHDSMIRRVSQEALGLLGGGYAILLQLAHPAVAAGVAEHSYFQNDPLIRLFRTLEFMHNLIFGSYHEAQAALRQFYAVHARIHGHLPQAAGRFPAGTAYTAGDPQLKLWVYATLVEASLVAHERFVEPLTLDERRRYYADTQTLARQLTIPAHLLPPTLEDFHHYMARMLASDALAVTGATRQLAWAVLDPGNVGIIPASTARLLRFVTAGLLPERLRADYGLAWSPRQQRRLDHLSRTTRRLRPWTPVWMWQSPLLDGHLPRLLLGFSMK